MWQKRGFWTQQLSGYILYTPQLLLNQFTLVNYFNIHQDAALLNNINYQNSERGIFFYIREQDKVSFTARLTSLILQQYKIGFKVELKCIKVSVVSKAVER